MSISGGNASNPYDFRSPVRQLHLLAGRRAELEHVNDLLRAAAAGRPTHLSLFGAAGYGKSSLLNAVASIAQTRRLLPIHLTLRGATVVSEIAFYENVFDAGLQFLIRAALVDQASPVLQGWIQQTRGGSLALAPDYPQFETGLFAAASLAGKVVTSVPVSGLQRDLDRLIDLGSPAGLKGVALCLDVAEYIDNNRDVAQSLAELAAATSRIVLITASEGATKLQAVNPRSWDHIEVQPLSGPPEVFEAMAKPLEHAEEHGLALDADTAQDVYSLTRGHPYEVNLVCHFIWEAVHAGEQARFALSTSVIERVLAELEEKGRHESSAAITLLSELTSSEYEVLARIAPYEAMTIKQMALMRLMLEEFTEEQISETEQSIRRDLRLLEERGVLDVEADRFSLCGGQDARLYAKYAAQRVAGLEIRYGAPYAQRATFLSGDNLGQALVGDVYRDALITAGAIPHEVGGSQAGRWLRGLCDAARDGDIPTLADFFLIPTRLANLGLDDGKGLLIVGLLLQIGVDEAEHLEVLVNVPELTVEEAAARAEDWVSSTREVRAKYDIRVLEHRVHALSPALGRNLLVYAQLRIMGQIAFHLYQAGMVEEASAALQEVVTDAEDLLHGNLTDPLVRSQFADALSRLGFMRATLERFDEARQLLERSAQLALDAHWLEEFNQAYVAARQGRLAEAATFATAAVDHIADRDSFVVLHADLCAPDGFSNGDARWNVVTLNGSWIKRFVSLQAAVWRARSRFEDREALLEQLDGLSRSAPVALLRLAAWAELMVAGRKDQASELFERAIEAAGLDDEDGLREEATRAVELISEVGPEPVQTPEDPAGRASAPEPAPPPERPDGRNGP